MKVGFLLMENILTLWVKSVLMPLGSTTVTLAAHTKIHKKAIGLRMSELIILNKELKDILKIVNVIEESG